LQGWKRSAIEASTGICERRHVYFRRSTTTAKETYAVIDESGHRLHKRSRGGGAICTTRAGLDQQRTRESTIHSFGERDGCLDPSLTVHADHCGPEVKQPTRGNHGGLGPFPETHQDRNRGCERFGHAGKHKFDIRVTIRFQNKGIDAGIYQELRLFGRGSQVETGGRADIANDVPVGTHGAAGKLDCPPIDRLDQGLSTELFEPVTIGSERVGEDRVGSGGHVATMNGNDLGGSSEIPEGRIIQAKNEPALEKPCAHASVEDERTVAERFDEWKAVTAVTQVRPPNRGNVATAMLSIRLDHVFFVRLR
jgi:hypothetical protein